MAKIKLPEKFEQNLGEIDYVGLYGVKSDETDFSGAIERSLKEDPKHLCDGFLKHLK